MHIILLYSSLKEVASNQWVLSIAANYTSSYHHRPYPTPLHKSMSATEQGLPYQALLILQSSSTKSPVCLIVSDQATSQAHQ